VIHDLGGSGKNLLRIPDPGVIKAPDLGSRIRIRNTANKRLKRLVQDVPRELP
jgi:hypothetical protein